MRLNRAGLQGTDRPAQNLQFEGPSSFRVSLQPVQQWRAGHKLRNPALRQERLRGRVPSAHQIRGQWSPDQPCVQAAQTPIFTAQRIKKQNSASAMELHQVHCECRLSELGRVCEPYQGIQRDRTSGLEGSRKHYQRDRMKNSSSNIV